jgi:hypothetical protein
VDDAIGRFCAKPFSPTSTSFAAKSVSIADDFAEQCDSALRSDYMAYETTCDEHTLYEVSGNNGTTPLGGLFANERHAVATGRRTKLVRQ